MRKAATVEASHKRLRRKCLKEGRTPLRYNVVFSRDLKPCKLGMTEIQWLRGVLERL